MALGKIQNRQLDDSQQIKLVQESTLELDGIDVVPNNERTSTLKDIFFVFLGSQMCFGIIVLGSIPITLGLSFYDALSSISVGLFIGSILFALLAPLGARTGTSSTVASGAHFGLRGRVFGTIISIFTALGFFALTVWTGGEAIAVATAKLFGWEVSKNLLAIGAGIIGLLVISAAIYGHKIIVATEKFVSYAVAAVLIIISISLFHNFNPAYAGGKLALGSVTATWYLSMAIAAALPVSYGIFLNDYTRYLPKDISGTKTILSAGAGIYIGCWIALVFAAAITTMFVDVTAPFVGGLMGMVAWWGVLLLVLVGIVGSQPQGSLCIYGAGLALQSLFPKFSRVNSTLILAVLGIAVVFIGIYIIDMVNMVIAFLAIDQCALAPWLAINIIGYRFVNKAKYSSEALFENQGKYWFSAGFNLNAVFAWISGFITGLMFIHTEFYSGPLTNLFGGVSLEWVFAGVVGGLIYYILEKISGRIR